MKNNSITQMLTFHFTTKKGLGEHMSNRKLTITVLKKNYLSEKI